MRDIINKDKRKFILDKTAKYNKPCVITLSGLPGSGKTTAARIFSKKLKLYILSNDFVRSKHYENKKNLSDQERKKINKKVIFYNIKRLIELFKNRVSIVLDSDTNDTDKLKKIEFLTKLFKYQIIKIKINSHSDIVNINRIRNRKEETLDLEIIGDNIKSFCYTEETYYKIKNRKPQLLENYNFDYILENNGNLEEYLDNLNQVIDDIILKKLTLNRRSINE